jgi:hypothetical protein
MIVSFQFYYVRATIASNFLDGFQCQPEFSGLVEKVVGSGRQAGLTHKHGCLVRQDDRDNRTAVSYKRSENVHPGAAGQMQVHHGDVCFGCCDAVQRSVRVLCFADYPDVVDRADQCRQMSPDQERVLDQKDFQREPSVSSENRTRTMNRGPSILG